MRSLVSYVILILYSLSSYVVSSAVAADPEQPALAIQRKIAFPTWENFAVSPWGMHRSGIDDGRTFRFLRRANVIIGLNAGGWHFEQFDIASGKSLGIFGRTDRLHDFAVSPDEHYVIEVAAQGQVVVWDLDKRVLVRQLDDGVNFISFLRVSFLDNRRCLLVGKEEKSLVACVWDIATGEELEKRVLPTDLPGGATRQSVPGLAISPSGSTLALVEDNALVLRDRHSGQLQRRLTLLPSGRYREANVGAMGFSPNGRLLAVAVDSGVRFYDVIAGTELPTLDLSERVRAIQFTSDGTTLRTLADDGDVRSDVVSEMVRPVEVEPAQESEVERLIDVANKGQPRESYLAVRRLAMNAPAAIAAIRNRVKPVTPLKPNEVDRILRQLASDSIQERKLAIHSLEGRIGQVTAAIEHGRARHPAVGNQETERVVRNRLQRLQIDFEYGMRIEELEFSPARARRNIELLDRIGTDESRAYLKEVAAGDQSAETTRLAMELVGGMHDPMIVVEPEQCLELLAVASSPRAYDAVCVCVQKWPRHRDILKLELERIAQLPSAGDIRLDTERLIANLSSDVFLSREEAAKQLVAMGKPVESFLRAKLETKPDPETKSRIEGILPALKQPELSEVNRLATRILAAFVLSEGTDSPILREVASSSKNLWLRQYIQALATPTP